MKHFLDNVEIMKINKGSKSLLISKYGETMSFHLSGDPDGAIKHESKYCSPNTVADICMNKMGFDLTSDEVVKISDFC